MGDTLPQTLQQTDGVMICNICGFVNVLQGWATELVTVTHFNKPRLWSTVTPENTLNTLTENLCWSCWKWVIKYEQQLQTSQLYIELHLPHD